MNKPSVLRLQARGPIKAIETLYKGYRFRSRLEARWAMFYDLIGLPWQYEVEWFDVCGEAYLPDFIVSIDGTDVVHEIKPENAYHAITAPRVYIAGTERDIRPFDVWAASMLADEMHIVKNLPHADKIHHAFVRNHTQREFRIIAGIGFHRPVLVTAGDPLNVIIKSASPSTCLLGHFYMHNANALIDKILSCESAAKQVRAHRFDVRST